MDLNRQVQLLIENAPDIESQLSVAAIAPVLQQVAATLGKMEYYVCQSHQHEWVVSTLHHRQQPNLAVKAIYAFSQSEDINKFDSGLSAAELAVKIPIIQLLFEVLATSTIDRIIFLDDSSDLERGKEVTRSQLEDLIAKRLRSMEVPPSLPPDVC